MLNDLFLYLFFPTDMPDKTATGTIAIQVEDFNDHCPTLTSKIQTMCTEQSSVVVNAVDEDVSPNGPPFRYDIIPEGTKGKWRVEHLNGEENTANYLQQVVSFSCLNKMFLISYTSCFKLHK